MSLETFGTTAVIAELDTLKIYLAEVQRRSQLTTLKTEKWQTWKGVVRARTLAIIACMCTALALRQMTEGMYQLSQWYRSLPSVSR
jgi:hypothetical protein